MAVAVENIESRKSEKTESWNLPEIPTVTFRSTINGQADALTEREMARIRLGVEFVGRRELFGGNEMMKAWGFDFQKGEAPNEITVSHRLTGQADVKGKVRREFGPLETSEFVLFDVSRVE